MKKIIPQSIKNIYHLFQAILANVWFGFPSRKLKVIGVTGTNGKTTTVQMIAKILEEAGKKIAVASTINFKIGEKEWVNDTKFTTFSSFKLQEFLKKAVAAGCEYALVEVTSHALDQNRVWGVDFNVAVITNITREHLDYHETMEEYARAKEKLFAMLKLSSDPTARPKRKADGSRTVAVVNLGMEFAEDFLKYEADQIYGYAVKIPNSKHQVPNKFQISNNKYQTVVAENIKIGLNNSQFTVRDVPFELNLPGEFNIENALAATCVGLSQNIPLEKISEALEKIKGVPGRMERIENDRGLEIIVDYAVTPDSLDKLYKYINEIRKSKRSDRVTKEEGGRTARVIAVFGSCGERDRGKRPIMGEIVGKFADFVIVTNEDPYGEDPARIINEVFSGVVRHKIDGQIPNFQFPRPTRFATRSGQAISNFQTNPKSENPDSKQIQNSKFKIQNSAKREGVNAWRILDRREAIKKALQIAKPGDIVVVTGKGAEETMAIRDERIPWNDPKVIREVLRERE